MNRLTTKPKYKTKLIRLDATQSLFIKVGDEDHEPTAKQMNYITSKLESAYKAKKKFVVFPYWIDFKVVVNRKKELRYSIAELEKIYNSKKYLDSDCESEHGAMFIEFLKNKNKVQEILK